MGADELGSCVGSELGELVGTRVGDLDMVGFEVEGTAVGNRVGDRVDELASGATLGAWVIGASV